MLWFLDERIPVGGLVSPRSKRTPTRPLSAGHLPRSTGAGMPRRCWPRTRASRRGGRSGTKRSRRLPRWATCRTTASSPGPFTRRLPMQSMPSKPRSRSSHDDAATQRAESVPISMLNDSSPWGWCCYSIARGPDTHHRSHPALPLSSVIATHPSTDLNVWMPQAAPWLPAPVAL